MRGHPSTNRAARRQRRHRKNGHRHYSPAGLPAEFELGRLAPTGLFPLAGKLQNLVPDIFGHFRHTAPFRRQAAAHAVFALPGVPPRRLRPHKTCRAGPDGTDVCARYWRRSPIAGCDRGGIGLRFDANVQLLQHFCPHLQKRTRQIRKFRARLPLMFFASKGGTDACA
jgi:hypothetical protein